MTDRYVNIFADFGFKKVFGEEADKDLLHDRPQRLQNRIFEKFFTTAEIAHFTPQERETHEDSLKNYRDMKNSLDTAKEEGRVEGRVEGKIEIAEKLISRGDSDSTIQEITGLSIEEIATLRRK